MPLQSRLSQNGSIMITIMAMLILISLGVGIVMLFSTSSLQKSEYNIKLRAASLAQAGFRYAAGEYISAGNLSAKFDRLAGLHEENVTLLNDEGSFKLEIYPYWFVTASTVNTSSTLPLIVLGKFPDGFQAALPATGTVKINTDFYEYSSGNASPGAGFNPDQFNITLNTSVTLPENTSVQLAFSPQSSQTVTRGGTLTLSPSDDWLNIFPRRNGLIEIFKDKTQSLGIYKYREKKQGSVLLTGITPVEEDQLPLTINSSSFVVLKKQALINSTGNLGTGSFAADLGIGLNVFITDELQIPADTPEPLDMGGGGPSKPEVFNDEVDGHTQLTNWEFNADDSIPESEKKTITTHEIQTEFGSDWNSQNYVTFQNFTQIEQDKGYTARVIDKERLPEAARTKNLNGLWGNASDNIYFVGDDGTILHWNGSTFTSMTSNTTQDLNAIWGVPKEKTVPTDTDNIFVGGDNGETLINESGAGWVHASQGQNYDIYAAFGISWGHFDGYGQAGTNPYNWDSPHTADVLANYNWYINEFGGHANFRCLWAVEEPYSDDATYGATGPQPRQNIMVGEFSGGPNAGNGIIMHEFYEPAVIIAGSPLRGIWGSAFDDIYAVGDAGSVYHNASKDAPNYSFRWKRIGNRWVWWRPQWEDSWQGQWIKIPAGDIPTTADLNGVYGNSADDFYIIGDNGTIVYNKGQGFELVPTAEVTTENLNSIWGSDRTGIYAVGDNGTIVFLGYPANKIGGHILPLSKNAELAAKWTSTQKFLNYTIQVKTVWGDQLDYGASGICFRWHQPQAGKYAGYGISYVRYDSSLNTYNDMIPDDIKPEFHGTREKNDRLLLVLWEQYIQGGAQQRRWLAYKDITDDSNVKKSSNGTPRDLSSLFVRVREKRVENVKLNDIEIYYGNASLAGQVSDNQYNNTVRDEYNPTFGTGSNTIKWPVFDIRNWKDCPNGPLTITCDEADAFTLVDNVSVAAAPVKAAVSTNYWIVNPNAEQTLLKNSFTIRTSRFTTPDGDSFGTQSDRSEIGLHVFGDIGDYGTQKLVSYTDFAVQLGVDSNAVNIQSGFGSLE
ncbi:MAG: hypothetical protein KKE62_17205 [Proteobacteria bacterium]|nr:hypothetical protein [Pseudomonadota bacterium]MBU1386460.1 hypothetical protein [Pseudomonadota bacterium]MBU1544571.1 hypothetical protein [Pseudomonadota bacterium]MBU2431787.1 hypothetical protein [Pseudomonadota bacterium]MBU2481218.1 hypothetical protein [Pseudomonadota bacterium]